MMIMNREGEIFSQNDVNRLYRSFQLGFVKPFQSQVDAIKED